MSQSTAPESTGKKDGGGCGTHEKCKHCETRTTTSRPSTMSPHDLSLMLINIVRLLGYAGHTPLEILSIMEEACTAVYPKELSWKPSPIEGRAGSSSQADGADDTVEQSWPETPSSTSMIQRSYGYIPPWGTGKDTKSD